MLKRKETTEKSRTKGRSFTDEAVAGGTETRSGATRGARTPQHTHKICGKPTSSQQAATTAAGSQQPPASSQQPADTSQRAGNPAREPPSHQIMKINDLDESGWCLGRTAQSWKSSPGADKPRIIKNQRSERVWMVSQEGRPKAGNPVGEPPSTQSSKINDLREPG